jgi:uncharacterized DUF497 family protein
MNHLRFEWDPQKAALNLRLHGVDFEEALTTFFDTSEKLAGRSAFRARRRALDQPCALNLSPSPLCGS